MGTVIKELVKAGHELSVQLGNQLGMNDTASLVQRLTAQLDITAAALREMTKDRDAEHADVLAWEKTMFKACGEDGYKSVAEKFAEMEAKCAALAAENAGLNEKMNKLATWPGIEFYSSAWEFNGGDGDTALAFMCDVQTPYTDAFLAEVLEQEPVAYYFPGGEREIEQVSLPDDIDDGQKANCTPLYAAPQLPQPAVVDEHYQHLNELYHAQEKRLFKIAQRIKGPSFDKYAYSPSQAIDVLESAIFGEREDDGRAAMLQGAEPMQGWIPCSERMPEEVGRYWCYVEEQNSLGKSHYQWNCSWNGDRWWVESENGGRVTHWMPLPAAPQQEVR